MAAEIQQKAGLKVLQVFHDTPPWAREGRSGGEFTHDLRILYRFCQGMARRFKGGVNAWESWNEANVKNFGGHTVNEMCSWQKAAWLGFKAGDPEVLVGWNATAASPTDQHAEGVLANETWPYFDTYNIHTYDWAHAYLDLWGPALKAASGRPLWITESDRGLKHINNPPWYDLSPSDERLKAEYMAQSYAQSLYVGASRHFHFVLGHYHEANGVQFGLLRKDLSPRPAYVALAAIGRFLAGAQSLGRWRPGHDVQVYGFRARPDGVEKDVLVAWAEKEVDWPARGVTEAGWNPPATMRCEEVFDFLGRSMGATIPPRLQSAPIFLVLPQGAADKISWQKQPETEFREGDVSPVVLQVLMPSSRRIRVEDKKWSEGHAYRFEVGEEMEITMAAYNFGEQPVKGSVVLKDIPLGWRLSSDQWDLELKPMERDTVSLKFVVEAGEGDKVTEDGWIKIQGRFGLQTKPVVAFRMVRN
jgi:hypothetical protein